ncbi:MAG: hypothetical protein ACLRSW_14890 [Christensenellaceae bacterium]
MKALGRAFADRKQYGKVHYAPRRRGWPDGDRVISTGCLTLDLALGIGGMLRGRIIEITARIFG